MMFNSCLNNMNILSVFRLVKNYVQYMSEQNEHLSCVQDCKI